MTRARARGILICRVRDLRPVQKRNYILDKAAMANQREPGQAGTDDEAKAAFIEAVLPLILEWHQSVPVPDERFVVELFDCQPLAEKLWDTVGRQTE